MFLSLHLILVQQYENLDLEMTITPLNINKYEYLLKASGYNPEESQFLLNGFHHGFDFGYSGVENRQSYADNIPFSVGDEVEMWNKIMKEVKAKRVAGPFKDVPFTNFIQSPIGLVPKAGNKTRLIFHLSFSFEDNEGKVIGSMNSCTPRELCSVKYNDLDSVIACCLWISKEADLMNETSTIFLGKTDLTSAFRVLPMKIKCFWWLVFKAKDPVDGKIK